MRGPRIGVIGGLSELKLHSGLNGLFASGLERPTQLRPPILVVVWARGTGSQVTIFSPLMGPDVGRVQPDFLSQVL